MKNKKREYTGAPLPFMGQKRNFLKDFKMALKEFPNDYTFIDLFGGSGLLSHTIKSVYPDSKVIYNDFDDYSIRIKNIPKTNRLLSELRVLLQDVSKDAKIPKTFNEKIRSILKKHYDLGYLDFITVSSSLRFGMNYSNSIEELLKGTYYNCVRKNDYLIPEHYLKGIEVVKEDYKILFERYRNDENVIFVVDPPYLQTTSYTYKNYWNLTDYLDVMNVIKDHRYFFFTSNKSSLIELFQWVEDHTAKSNPFKGATMVSQKRSITYQSTYTDIMIYK